MFQPLVHNLKNGWSNKLVLKTLLLTSGRFAVWSLNLLVPDVHKETLFPVVFPSIRNDLMVASDVEKCILRL